MTIPQRIRVDLHNHTNYSKDSPLDFDTIIKQAQERGLDGMAITDHNRIEGALELQKIAPFKIIPGEEVRTADGEIIGLFIHEWIPPKLSAEETIKRIKDQGGITYVPHPFDRLRKGRLRTEKLVELLDQLDVIEVSNARAVFVSDNLRANAFAIANGKLRGAGSDAHTKYEIGTSYVELPPFDDAQSFLQSLRRAKVIGNISSPLVHFLTRWEKMRRRFVTVQPGLGEPG